MSHGNSLVDLCANERVTESGLCVFVGSRRARQRARAQFVIAKMYLSFFVQCLCGVFASSSSSFFVCCRFSAHLLSFRFFWFHTYDPHFLSQCVRFFSCVFSCEFPCASVSFSCISLCVFAWRRYFCPFCMCQITAVFIYTYVSQKHKNNFGPHVKVERWVRERKAATAIETHEIGKRRTEIRTENDV